GGFVVFYALAGRPRAPEGSASSPRQRPSRLWPFVGKMAAAVGAGVLAMLPVIVPYVQVQGSHEFTRGIFEVERYSNRLASFLAVYQGNPLYRALLAPFADPGPWPWERAAFPGLGVLLLSLIAIFPKSNVQNPKPVGARHASPLQALDFGRAQV